MPARPESRFLPPATWARALVAALLLCCAFAVGAGEVEEGASIANEAAQQGELGQAQTEFARARQLRDADIAQAMAAQQSGIALAERVLPPGHRTLLAARTYLAQLLREGGRAKEAASLIETVLPQLQSQLGPADIETLHAMQIKGLALYGLGRYREAEAWQREVLARHEAVLGRNHEETLRSLNNLAEYIGEGGDINAALPLVEESYARHLEVLGEHHDYTLRSLANLANWYRRAGRLEASLTTAHRAVVAASRFLGEAHYETIRALRLEAYACLQLGQFERGLPLAEAAYARLARQGHGAGGDYERALEMLAEFYRRLGRYAESRAMFHRLIDLQTASHGRDNELTVTSETFLGRGLLEEGLAEPALALFEHAYAFRRRAWGESNPSTAYSLLMRALAEKALGRFAPALEHAQAASGALTAYHGASHPRSLMAMEAVGATYLAAGRPAEAATVFRAALARYRQSGREDSAEATTVMAELAGASEALGGEGEARSLNEAVVERADEFWQLDLLPQEDRRAISAGWLDSHRALALVHARAGRGEAALAAIERMKGRALLEAITFRRANVSEDLDPQDRERLAELTTRLAALSGRIQDPALTLDARLALRADQSEAMRAAYRLRRELAERHPKFALLSRAVIASPEAAANVLGKDELFVDYVLTAKGDLWAAAMTADGLAGVYRLGRIPQPASTLAAYRQLLLGPAAGEMPAPVWERADGSLLADQVRPRDARRRVLRWEEASRRLSRVLVQGLAPLLKRHARLIVSPDGALALVPFETLHWQGRRLLQSHVVSYAASLSVLVRLRQDLPARATSRGLLAMGAPAVWPISQRGVASVPDEPEAAAWLPLPHAQEEMRASIGRFAPASSLLLSGGEARESRLLALDRAKALRAYDFLLFSTHGRFDPVTPSRSAIVLEPDDAPGGEDGYVTAAEWAAYDLDAEAVILSACDTARGRYDRGEAVTGLPFAIHLAGGRNVVVSLWPVIDAVSPQLVSEILGGCAAGDPPALALAKAKRTLSARKRYADPAFWAGLVIYGQ